MITYTYDPSRIGERGVDQMRFELGDTLVNENAESAVLSDQEITGMIGAHRTWNGAKLALATGVYRKLAYEVSTKAGPVAFELQQRAEQWRKIVDDLKQESVASAGISGAATAIVGASPAPSYFHAGMQENLRTGGTSP